MIYMCEEVKNIINKIEDNNMLLSLNLVIYEILNIYKEDFGLTTKELEIFHAEPTCTIDKELYNTRFHNELESEYPEGIKTLFDILEKTISKESDIKFDLLKAGITRGKIEQVKARREEEDRLISKYTINLNKSVQKNAINIVDREKELKLLEIFLSMKTKNNVLITGKPGVGKTTLVEALAQKIEQNRVNSVLLGKQVLSVDICKLLANTKYRGDFEERLTKLLDLCIKRECILFIDEAHIVIGAGASEGGISAANILKPYLLNSKLKFICATTEDEYRTIIKDKAFNRRFNAITLNEFTVNEMISIGRELCEPYEQYHKISLQTNDLTHIVNKLGTEKYSKRAFPDKFIEFVDFIGSYYSNVGIINREQIDEGFIFYEDSRILAG